MRWIASLGLAALAAAVPVPGAGSAAAQSAVPGTVAIEGFPLPLDLPPPADTGKPRFFVPPLANPPPGGCAAAFDCRVRVIGTVQRNGAVELNATMLKW